MTVLFADVVHSMDIAAAVGAERLREIMSELVGRSAGLVKRYGGKAESIHRRRHHGGVRCADCTRRPRRAGLHRCVADTGSGETVGRRGTSKRRHRVAVPHRVLNSGEVVAGEIGTAYTAVGHHVGMAQRMEAAAPPGGVLCSQSTARLVERTTRLGPARSRHRQGLTQEPISAQRLHAVQSAPFMIARDEGPMLGRDAELGELADAFNARHGSLVGIVGAPGVGKSRLIREFSRDGSKPRRRCCRGPL